MKRSKVFLAITTCLLGIAGLAASRAHKVSEPGFYLTSANNDHCVAAGHSCFTVGNGGLRNKCTVAAQNHHTLYTKQVSSSSCGGKILYTTAE